MSPSIESRPSPVIQLATPCKADWENMTGDEMVRHCAACDKQVYNLSALSLEEVADLIQRKEGRLCVRFYRRADGTVMTDDCPVGLRAVRRRLAAVAGMVTALMAYLMSPVMALSERMRPAESPAPRASSAPVEELTLDVGSPPAAPASPSRTQPADRQACVAGGMPPPVAVQPPSAPAVKPLSFKVVGIAGSPGAYSAVIEYKGETQSVTVASQIPPERPELLVKTIEANRVVVWDYRTRRLVSQPFSND